MSVKSKVSVSGLNVSCKISASKDDLQKHIDAAVQEVKKSLKMPGFRPGHVPDDVVMSQKKPEVFRSALENIINEEIKNVIDKNKYRLISRPTLDKEDQMGIQEVKDISVDVSFWIAPDLKDVDLKKLKVEMPSCEVLEDDIEDGIKRLKEMDAKDVELEPGKAIEKGIKVDMDFEGTKDGVPFAGGSAKNFIQEVGVGKFIKDFDDAIVGMLPKEEKEFSCTFPKDYQAKDLAGQKVVFRVKVNNAYKKEAQEFTDEYVKKFKVKDLKDLRDKVKSSIQDQYEKSAKSLIKKDVFELAANTYKFEVPQNILDENVKVIEGTEDGKKMKKSDIEKKALRDLKIYYIVDHLSTTNNISVTDSEVIGFIVQEVYAGNLPSPDKVQELLKDERFKSNIKDVIMENKVLDFILDNCSLKKVVLNKKDFEKRILSKNSESQK